MDNHDEIRRLEALRLAVSVCARIEDPYSVLKAARAFDAWLAGAEQKERPEDQRV